MKKISVALLAVLLNSLTGCALVKVPLRKADSVRLVYKEDSVATCQFKGDVVGSAGHWYNAWLIANEDLTQGALNDARNKASALGANTVFIPLLVNTFTTSVTILGEAYSCQTSH